MSHDAYAKIIKRRYLINTQRNNTIRQGFTIVELLIVIVVIGILAAITIVGFNGVSQKARVASLTSDLDNASKRLKLDQITNSTYPATTAAADGGAGLRSTPGTVYQYTVDNTVSPQTFCLTATNGTTSYYIDQSSSPQAGACAGHSTGGTVTITNLATNPSCESNVTNWTFSGGTGGGNATMTQGTGSAVAGSHTCLQTSTVASTGAAGGPNITAAGASAVTGNATYTFSGYVRVNKVQRVAISIRWMTSAGAAIGADQTSTTAIVTNPGEWQRASFIGVAAPATATQVRYFFYAVAGGTNWNVGDTIEVDAVLVTAGSQLYAYGDGNTAGWSWTTPANANNSTSTGPSI